MINYNNILVLENDPKEIPSWLKTVLDKEQVCIDTWFDFNISFHWDKAKAFGRLLSLTHETLLVSTPSFAGDGNSFEHYLSLFLKLKDLDKKINLAILYPDNFYILLLKFVSADSNALKKQNNLERIKEVLDFHSIYEINYSASSKDNLQDNVHITFDYLMENYFETHQKLGRTKVMIIETSEVFEVYYVYYHESIEKTELVLYIESDPNNKYKLNQIKKL